MTRPLRLARLSLALGLASTLLACAPSSYEAGDPQAESYRSYQARREAALLGSGPGPVNPYVTSTPAPATAIPPGTLGAGSITSGPITAGPIGAAPAASPYPAPGTPLDTAGLGGTVAGAAPLGAPVPAAPAPLAPAAPRPAGISDEQDFDAVAARESIESDAERIARNRAQYQEVAPGALPERTNDGPSPIIDYALNAPNRLGESIYRRSGLSLSDNRRACGKYGSPAEAQEAFLKRGGPNRDPLNLDPDGDGFACTWDPTPFQAVRSGG